MKRIWILILFISLGLNLGLGFRLLKDPGGGRESSHLEKGRNSRRFEGRWADRDSTTRQEMFNRRIDAMADRLGLDSEQREVFRRVHIETGRLLMRKRIIISEKRDLLHDLVTREEVDQDGIRRAIAELGQEQAVLDSLVAETVLQEMAVLTPEQRAGYLEMLSFEMDGPRGRRGRGGPGHRRQ
jgi:Spy/CpxP family protein refolding chaperone